MSDKNFTHLHVHTMYSHLDGYNKPSECAKRVKELGMTAVAITDHNHVGGVLEFQQECIKAGVKPILGLEGYWTRDTNILSLNSEIRTDMAIEAAKKDGIEIAEFRMVPAKRAGKFKKEKIKKSEIKDLIAPYQYDTSNYHIILIAINQKGWSNLVKLQSESSKKCTFNARFHCDDEMLERYNEGLIMTTACMGNVIPELINQGKYSEAEAQLDKWHSIFGDRFYLEIQPFNSDKQFLPNMILIEWAHKKGIKVVATTDVHYTRKEDFDDHDTLLCVGLGKIKEDENRLKYSNELWIRSYDEMLEAFKEQYDNATPDLRTISWDDYLAEVEIALANTNEIADQIESIKLGSDTDLFPKIDIPHGLTPEGYLTMTCFRKLYAYKNANPDIDLYVYEKRLDHELNIINTKGFAPYILVVQDYIEWANRNNCPTGPGRGSGAGSLVLFLLGITKIIDPIKYKLLFFRFLTMDRTSPPDIDTDFEYYGRDSVIHYLESKYGKDNVAHIGTYSELGVKSGLKDVARVLNIPFEEANELSKKVDDWSDDPELEFKKLDALKDSDREIEQKAWQEFNAYEEKYPELFRLARRFEGIPRQMGVHASGILITPMAINDLFPTRSLDDGTTITLYTGPQVEELKAIKFDILGLKTLSVIKKTLQSIDENLTMDDLYGNIDIDDSDMFSMIQSKETEGLFQIESNLFKGMIEDVVPSKMNDIVVLNALGRPGPISAGMPKSYALRKHGKEESVEPLPNTWDIVEETYGTICYQEQIMLIAKRVAGFDDNQADSQLRKAFAKKKKDKMAQCRQWFIYGKLNQAAPEGYDETNVDQPMYDPKGKYGEPIIGGINNGYDEEQLKAFWHNIEGFADYLFNLSHAACYSYITVLTGWLKKYHPAKFMAALLSIQDKPEKIDAYVKVARKMGIEVKAPHINLSQADFAEIEGEILYGLGSVKGVGASSVPAIINNRPYANIQEAIDKIGKKSFNKRVGLALIKAGAFDHVEPNRNRLINSFYEIREDEDDHLDPEAYNEKVCIEYERELLGTTITHQPWWDEVQPGEEVIATVKLVSVREKADKNGNMMAFVNGTSDGCDIRAVVFSRVYCANVDRFDMQRNSMVVLQGTKDERGSFKVNKVLDPDKAVTKKTKKDTIRKLDFLDLEQRLEGVI